MISRPSTVTPNTLCKEDGGAGVSNSKLGAGGGGIS